MDILFWHLWGKGYLGKLSFSWSFKLCHFNGVWHAHFTIFSNFDITVKQNHNTLDIRVSPMPFSIWFFIHGWIILSTLHPFHHLLRMAWQHSWKNTNKINFPSLQMDICPIWKSWFNHSTSMLSTAYSKYHTWYLTLFALGSAQGRFCSMRFFLRGRVAGPAHNPPPFVSWAWDQAMGESKYHATIKHSATTKHSTLCAAWQ